MQTRDRRSDRQLAGRGVALFVIVADLLLVPGPLVAVFDLFDDTVGAGEGRFHLAVWALALVPLVAAFVLAVRAVRGEDGPSRAATWAGGLFVTGLAVLVAAVLMRDSVLAWWS